MSEAAKRLLLGSASRPFHTRDGARIVGAWRLGWYETLIVIATMQKWTFAMGVGYHL